ncbi:MAG: adenine deaminase [Bacteroidales bacterium]|jgi:adenine deaminase|nr:adenine deaminase [Bacteroidales bacterium]
MNDKSFSVRGRIVDVVNGRIFPGTVVIDNGRIMETREEEVEDLNFILPGLVDAHIHIESSMLIPSEFARLAVIQGTVATVSDPHEIANVLGVEGIRFMIRNGKKVPFKFYFGASSCVPATPFETAGASLGTEEIEELLRMDEIRYLSEMMNFPGVLRKDENVMAKLALAGKYGKPVDGHAPGLRGEEARSYIEAGISTDHECFTLEEATEKADFGMKILIREGSAARNFDALAPLLGTHPDRVMFCSDDRHPDDLAQRHINDIARRAILKGYDLISVIRACTLNPKMHYKLDTGLLQPGDPADFIIIDNPASFRVLKTYIDGKLVAEHGRTLIGPVPEVPLNNFHAHRITADELVVRPLGNKIRVIEALEGQLITHELAGSSIIEGDNVVSDTGNDVLKMVVINRYTPSAPAMAFIRSFGLKRGAIASTVAHDSHNIIAVGVKDEDIARAVNTLVDSKGGICCVDGEAVYHLPLPVAGLMSASDGFEVASKYEYIDSKARELGSKLHAPFMTLSFMALLVIPALKLSDKGLFDGNGFRFTSLFLDQI